MSNNPSETSGANQSALQGTCFVVMGFGKKTDFETGRVLDLDQSYRNLIKPAVEKAGLKCVRADEIVHSGLIDLPMYEQLLQADVVVADLSTSNRNAFYELGVRHALRPYTTVVIAEEQMMKTAPFDVNHISIRKYRHLGEDIGFSEVQRFTQELSEAILTIMATQPKPAIDSPVYRFIARLTPPSVEAEIKQAIEEARAAKGSAFARASSTEPAIPAHSELMERVDEAQRKGDWLKAKMLLEEIRDMRKAPIVENAAEWKQEDPYILQRLALATYKSEYPGPEAALAAARDLLQLLEPEVSNDTETLGLWAAVHKRLWDLASRPRDLDEAIRGAERGYYLRNDYYNGINYAFLLNVRASIGEDLAEAVADFVQARRVRREVVRICEQRLASDHRTETRMRRSAKALESRYWVLATLAEAHLGLEEDRLGKTKLEEAFAAAPHEWMKRSTHEQIGKLQALLEKSPLRNLRSSR